MSEEKKNVELKEEDLKNVSGGASGDVSTLNGYSVGDSHQVNYADGSGYHKATITQINEFYPPLTPYYVRQEWGSNGGGYSIGYCWWPKRDLDNFWSKTTE